MCVREIARVRERRALFVSGYACLCGHVWKLEVDVSMFSPITFPSCVLRPGFSLNLELTILVIRSSNLRDPTSLHLSVLGLYAYIQHTWLLCRCWGSKNQILMFMLQAPYLPISPAQVYRLWDNTGIRGRSGEQNNQGIRLFQCCYCGNLLDDSKCASVIAPHYPHARL